MASQPTYNATAHAVASAKFATDPGLNTRATFIIEKWAPVAAKLVGAVHRNKTAFSTAAQRALPFR